MNGQLPVAITLLVVELFTSEVHFYRNLYYVDPPWELLSPPHHPPQLSMKNLNLGLPNAVFYPLSNGQLPVALALPVLELFTSEVDFYRILDLAEFPWWSADPLQILA